MFPSAFDGSPLDGSPGLLMAVSLLLNHGKRIAKQPLFIDTPHHLAIQHRTLLQRFLQAQLGSDRRILI
jgi:hypothetical protein